MTVKIEENPKVTNWAINNMITKMGERDYDGPPHASELFSCFRKGVLKRNGFKEELTQEDILRFAVGFAVQEWFFGEEKDGEEHFGVIFSADHSVKGQVFEFKTTRFSYMALPKDENGKGIRGAEKVKFDPENAGDWVPRTLAYMSAHNVKKAHIMVFFLFQGVMSTWTITATDADMKEVRADIEARRDVFLELDAAYKKDESLPSIETRAGDYECNYCPFYDSHCFHELTAAGVKVRRFN